MILFVNVFITNQRMVEIKGLNSRRCHSKLDIFKYSLASYAVIPFTKIIINYELDEPYIDEYSSTDNYIISLFSNTEEVTIGHKRIDSFVEWIQVVQDLNKSVDDFIFFTCNDDHIFIDSSLKVLNETVKVGYDLLKDNYSVSILISHWQEFYASTERYNTLKSVDSKFYNEVGGSLLSSLEYCKVTELKNSGAIQILSKSLLNHWFLGNQALPKDLRRTDQINYFPEHHRSLIPHKEIVRHFDAYTYSNVSLDVVPVMFIPNGFFENEIKIQYGGDKRVSGFTWLHPNKKMYQSEIESNLRISDELCDLNIPFWEIPLFWRNRISYVQRERYDDCLVIKSYCLQLLRELCSDTHLGFTPMNVVRKNLLNIFQKRYPDVNEELLKNFMWNLWDVNQFLNYCHNFLSSIFYSRNFLYKSLGIFYAGLCIVFNIKLVKRIYYEREFIYTNIFNYKLLLSKIKNQIHKF